MWDQNWSAFLIATFLSIVTAQLSEWFDATTNHYGGAQDGMIDPFNPVVLIGGCNYGDLDPTKYPFYNVASFAPESSLIRELDQFGCGACFEIRCSDTRQDACHSTADDQSIVVMSGGTCGLGCGDRQVNLHVFAFDKLAPIRLGNISVQIRQVVCQPLSTLMILVKNYRVEEGGYIKLVIRNVPASGGLNRVSLRHTGDDNDDWTELENLFGASWEGSNLPTPPFDIQLIESFGNQVILEQVIMEPGFVGEIDSGKQFPNFPSAPETERTNFVDDEAGSPLVSGLDPSSESPTPFRVSTTTSPSLRPEVDPDDLNVSTSFTGGK
eukprot:g6012.t1